MTTKEIKRFFEPIKEQKIVVVFYTLFSLFTAFFWLYSIEILKKITKEIEVWNIENVYTITYWFIGFIVLSRIIWWFWKDLYPICIGETKKYLQKKYVKDFIMFENNSYEKIGTWKLIALIERWIESWSGLVSQFFWFWLQISFTFLFSFFYVYKIIWIYTLIIVVLTVFLLLLTKIINTRAIAERSKMIDYLNIYTKDFVKIIMSKFEILQNNKTDKEISRLNYLTDKATYHFRKRMIWLEISFWMNESINNFLKILAIFVVWIWVIKWTYDFSDFLAITAILTLLDAKISKAVDFYKNFTKDYVKVEKLYNLFDKTPRIEWYETWKDFKHIKWDFEVKNLSFSYSSGKMIFENFDLDIKWWKKTAIIWRSGSGKTTLIKLISGFLKAQWGNIIIDKQNINDISLKSYYKHIWYLTQEPSIFDGTIIDNLTYWSKKDISDSEIKKALKDAKADFVFEFKGWLNTEIWERWIRLSWGQRQRLAIAKIFIKDPEIIILDEPTSALDSFSEEKVTKAINNLFKHRTVIVVAHRLQTVKKADDIIVMDWFKVIERWTHKELLKHGKYYKEMVDLQSGVLV